MKSTILIVIPTFGNFDYAEKAATSALLNTKTLDPYVMICDDASPDEEAYNALIKKLKAITVPSHPKFDSIFELRFSENGGLTRSWNHGLSCAKLGADYCCVTNSDVIFADNWDRDIVKGLESGYALVGPVTNAPGTNEEQYVAKYSTVYQRANADKTVDAVQRELHKQQADRFKETSLNGFCLVASTETWWYNGYDFDHVFCPRNDFNSKGQPNPTPLMTLNEYELQRRWHAKGLKTAACLCSYVFHYRAVSRGDKHKRGDWLRMQEEGKS